MTQTIRTRCVVVGGGPAGMMFGYLLARGGVDVCVLEKHADFLRDFRGDTIHPSTLGLMKELGLLEDFLALPHGAITKLTGKVGDDMLTVADFSQLPEPINKLVIMPQWDFLKFLADKAKASPHWQLMMETAATGLVERDGRTVGVKAKGPDGDFEIEADVVVACDGRHSTIRDATGMKPIDIGAPMDILWFALPRRADDPVATGGTFAAGAIFVMIDRGDVWQCGYVVAKGGDAQVRADGLDAFRARVAKLAPALTDRLDTIKSLDDVKLLTVGVDRLKTWHRPGLLLIGDAAHTMSPVGGVGINLAVQDAVAAANILVPALRVGAPSNDDLAAVQARREFPARATQSAQVFIQKNIISAMLHKDAGETPHAPLLLRALTSIRWFRRIPARAVGIGVRPEHISPEILNAPDMHATHNLQAAPAPLIAFDDFLKVDVRIGTIVAAEPYPEARKPSIKMTIDFGPAIGTKRSSAQVAALYTPQDLIGRQVAGVVNFPPRHIGKFMSEVLTLGFADESGNVVLFRPDRTVPNGSRLF